MLSVKLSRGVTLIEMIVVVAILAILVAIAAPSFTIMLANAQIRTAAQAIHDGLQLARVEAIRQNGRVIFTKNALSGWTLSTEPILSTIQTRSSQEGSQVATVLVTPSAATKVTFNSLGRVVPNTDTTASISQLDIDVPSSLIPAADSRQLRINVSAGGAIRLCDPNSLSGTGTAC